VGGDGWRITAKEETQEPSNTKASKSSGNEVRFEGLTEERMKCIFILE